MQFSLCLCTSEINCHTGATQICLFLLLLLIFINVNWPILYCTLCITCSRESQQYSDATEITKLKILAHLLKTKEQSTKQQTRKFSI